MSATPSIVELRREAQRAREAYLAAEEALQRAWDRKCAADKALDLAENVCPVCHPWDACPVCDRP